MGLITKKDSDKIVKAVQQAEKECSGEIRVHIQKRCNEDIVKTAEKKFNELKMYKTADRNGVLIFIAIKDKKFAIIGDKGIHEAVSTDFWEKTADAMKGEFIKDDIAAGIVEGVLAVGQQLKIFFPYTSDDINELSDEVSIDENC
jgi:uncharacterized membrane protein